MSGPKLKYEIGDRCWIRKSGMPLEGQVVYKLRVPGHFAEFYVIEPVDQYMFTLEVRDALLMSETRDGLLPFEQRGAP